MTSKIVGVVASTAIASAMMLSVGASSASAAPTGCKTGGGGTYATAYCSGGTGSYQAYARCFNPSIPGATFWKFVEGPWVAARSGKTASVSCPFLYVVDSRGVGIRN